MRPVPGFDRTLSFPKSLRLLRGLRFVMTVAVVTCAIPMGPQPAGAGSVEGLVLDGGAAAQGRPLRELVREYLTTDNSHRAGELKETILQHPRTSVDTIEAAVRTEQAFVPQPVGVQPRLPVRVGDQWYRYGLYVPSSYRPEKAYALVVCLHGAGFTGDSYLDRWRTRLGEGYILACPTLIQGNWWIRQAERLVLATIRTVRLRYHIDPDRIFLTGMSNGGIGAWFIGSHHAPLFAGIGPMAGGLEDFWFPFLDNLRNTPVYIIHGRHDQVMPVRLSRSIAERLSQLGYAHVYKEHDRSHPMAGGHFFPREELSGLITWLDDQRRDPLPTHITLVRDASHLTRFSWARIDATDRIAYFPENITGSRDELMVNRVYATLDARVTGKNRIEVRTLRIKRYTLFLNKALVDLVKPVEVVTNGQDSFSGRVRQDPATLLREARLRNDHSQLFSVELSLAVESRE